MPRPDPVPSPPKSLVERFLAIFKWLVLLSVVIAVIAVLLVARGENSQDVNVLVATGLGAGFTVLLGSALMVLSFLSSRSGHDEAAGRKRTGDDQ
jgi:ABC-type transport system involved in multi-copper enzyme maturation permease subunit